ncbi:MAG: glycosyltransferase family 2 protein, partial [Cellulomonadaceae bacterium]|nr:glycosyltransferase family 2 protein [Cellulomonadaceae bacterium]
MTDARTDAPAVVGRPRSAHVTAVVVTRGATEYLSSTLAALAAQTTAPDRLVVVDAADAADAEQVGALLSGLTGPELVIAESARTFGSAVRRALEVVDDPSAQGRRWLWLLHDDSAPEPTALAELLRAVEIAPSVAVAGCKQRTWSGPVRVLEVGVTTSRFGRRMTGLDEPEVDQGQHDGREDVLGVGLAGALVRRDVWDELGGTDPALGPYGDGLDLSRRARLAGHRVVVVPAAVVRHAQASLVPGARPDWDVRRSVRARREAYVHSQLVGVPGWLVPVVALLAVGAGVLRALGRLVTKEPQLVGAELVAPWAVLARPRRIASARSLAASTRRVARRTLRPLQGTWREVVSAERDRRLTAAEGRRTREAPSELELTELAALRTRRRAALAALLVAAVAVTAAAVGPLVTRVVAGARLSGDGLPFGDADLGALWSSATSGWAAGGLGAAGPSDPFLLTLVPLTALTGTVGGASAVVMLGALVLAALGAWFAAGAATRSVALRMWAALAWTGAPALLLGVDQGRLGAVVAHCMLPWVALGVARGVGAARIDAVESGLVGAQRVGQTAAPVDAGPQAVPVRAAARTA